jgi:DNA polymerase III subunit delta
VTDIMSEIAAGRIAPVYVLTGDEPFLAGRAVAALLERVVPPVVRAFNHDVVDGKAGAATAVLNAARTGPMMGDRRLVVVRDADAIGAGLADLIPYIADPSPRTVLVLIVAKADGRLKFYQTAKKRGYLHELAAPRPLAPWLRREAERRGARLSEDGARRLAEVVGADLGRLDSSIDQLSLFVGDDRAIEADDVDELIAETRERTVFELANAVGEGDRARALRAVARLFEQRESAVGVAMMLARHVRQLAQVKDLLAERASPGEIGPAVGVPPFAVQGLMSQARRMTAAALARGHALLAKADRDLKGPVKGALGERVVIERLVGELLGLA